MKLSINKKVVTSKDHGEIVILNMDNGNMYGLDGIGSEIWNLIQDKVPFEKMVEHLHNAYGISSLILEKDVAKFTDALIKYGLVIRNE